MKKHNKFQKQIMNIEQGMSNVEVKKELQYFEFYRLSENTRQQGVMI
jgi:hypothetical protein